MASALSSWTTTSAAAADDSQAFICSMPLNPSVVSAAPFPGWTRA